MGLPGLQSMYPQGKVPSGDGTCFLVSSCFSWVPHLASSQQQPLTSRHLEPLSQGKEGPVITLGPPG